MYCKGGKEVIEKVQKMKIMNEEKTKSIRDDSEKATRICHST